MPISSQELTLMKVLSEMEIPYERFEHPPVLTVEEARLYDANIPGARCKNLFLRDKSGKKHFLVITLAETRVGLTNLGKHIRVNHLSFASPVRLMQYLGSHPGAVSPFGLIHDLNHSVVVVLDESLIREENAGFHPNVNTATLVITTNDLCRFIKGCGNSIIEIDFSRLDDPIDHCD
jgi:Ala-tRNA(Pro) deacylase